jgi:uncharacterized protein involved in cysteine biosynthesis
MGTVMFAALSKAIAQCADPAFRRVLWRAVGISLAVFLALWAFAWVLLAWGGGWLLDWLVAEGATGFWVGVLEVVFGVASVGGILFATFILFPAVMVLILELMLEPIALAVEQRHYPGRPPARAQPWREVIATGLVFVAVAVAVNLLALPLYFVLLFVPPFNLFLFYGVNGYLFGREYFELVSLRRLDEPEAKRLRRRYRGRVFLAGALIAIMMTMPIVNLFAPIVATAFMLHTFEALRQRAAAAA